MRTVCAQPDGSMSSLLQSTGSSPYVLVHIVGPLAKTTSPPFKREVWLAHGGSHVTTRVGVANGEHQLSLRKAPLGVWRPVMVRGRRYQSLLGTYIVFPLRPVGRCEVLIQLKKGALR